MLTRNTLIALAREWEGTPYRHQASLKGAGADCLGFIRGLYREAAGREPERPPAYTPDWGEARIHGGEPMLEAARRHLIEKKPGAARVGDVLLFRMSPHAPVKHCALLCAPGRMIHAWSGRAVCETGIGPWWARRLTHVFTFPFVSD